MGSSSTKHIYTPVKGQPRPAWTYRAARRNAAHSARQRLRHLPKDAQAALKGVTR